MSWATKRASYEEGWTNNFETLATKKEWISYEDSTPTMKQASNEGTLVMKSSHKQWSLYVRGEEDIMKEEKLMLGD